MTLRTRSLRNIFNSKVLSPRTTTAFELPSSQACRRGDGDSLVDFSRR